jgi:hypothetical protein
MSTNRYVNLVNGVLTQQVPNTSSAGAGDAGKLIALNAAGALDATMLPSGVGATAVTATASAAISAGMLINLWSNAGVLSVRPADSTAAGSPADGYATAAIANGATGTVNLGQGIITGLTGLTLGAEYFLGTVGALVAVAPSAAGNVVQRVGRAVSATSLDFQAYAPVTVA